MKRVAFGVAVALMLAVGIVPQAQATSFLRIQVDAGPIFLASNAGTLLTLVGNLLGVDFSITLTGNSPGTPTLAFISDTKTLSNLTGVPHTITIDAGQTNFTQPTGAVFLSGSQTANWTTSTAGDSQSFTAWLRNTNDFVVPGGSAAASSANCVSPGGQTQSCSLSTPDVPANATAPYAITMREVITMANGTIATFTGAANLNPAAAPPQVPEPGTWVLLGTGMLILVGNGIRRRRK